MNPPRKLTHNGKAQTLHEWAAELGCSPSCLRVRLDQLGWSVTKTLTTPVDTRYAARGQKQSRAAPPIPPLKRHSSGQAYVRWTAGGRRHSRYLGAWGTPEVAQNYAQFCADWHAGLANLKSGGGGISVAELAVAYTTYAEGYYLKDGKPTSEVASIRSALEVAVIVGGLLPTSQFDGEQLKRCQQLFIEKGLSRKTVNRYVRHIVRCFAWGSGENDSHKQPLVPPLLVLRLKQVRPLLEGRTAAPDYPPVRAVAWADVEQMLPHLDANELRRAQLERLVRLHWLTGLRSTELLRLRLEDLDRTGSEWCYRLRTHKSQHRGKSLVYWLGPKAQAIVLEAAALEKPDGLPLFAIPAKWGVKQGRKWVVLNKESYRRIIGFACKKAGVTRWHPHQLRHSRATEVARHYRDSEAGAAAIGDSPDLAREVYIDPSEEIRRKIARETG